MSAFVTIECELGHTHYAVAAKDCKNKEKHQEHNWSITSTSRHDIDPYTGDYQVYGPYFCKGVEPWHEFKDGMIRKINGRWYFRAQGSWWIIIESELSTYQDNEIDMLTKDGLVKTII